MVGRCARRRAHDRHGAAAAGLGSRLRRRAAGLSGRLRRLHHPRRAARRTGATTSSCAGLEKFRIDEERYAREGIQRYRVARIESIRESTAGSVSAIQQARQKLERLLARKLQKTDHDFIPKDVPDSDLVHAIAQHLEPLEKQALLECNSLLERCETLVELLEMRMMPSHGGKSRMH